MGSLKDLALRMQQIAAKLPIEASRAAISVSEEALQDLIWVTPVDTSKALSNWQVSTGMYRVLRSQALPPYVPGKGGDTADASRAEALTVGIMRLQSKKPGDKVVLSNVAPYIMYLNQGSSTQFSGGFVERVKTLIPILLQQYKLDL